jgi:hypothetical protein
LNLDIASVSTHFYPSVTKQIQPAGHGAVLAYAEVTAKIETFITDAITL